MARSILKSSVRIIGILAAITVTLLIGYTLWQPGETITDGRHDQRSNGIWIQHGWLGDDAWFTRYRKDAAQFRDAAHIESLADRFRTHGIRYVFPHVCPCEPGGRIAAIDHVQAARFLDQFNATNGFEVLPWIGGALDVHAFPSNPTWRKRFVASVVDLLAKHPRFAGVQVNIEPMPSGHAGFLALLDELRAAIPADKLLSVAAYPPPTRWHPHADVHWDEDYFRTVAARCDQVVPMMYDTAISRTKIYRQLMTAWTREVLTWSNDKQVLLGVPAYDDAEAAYHDPDVENLTHALAGIHAGLNTFEQLPANYGGIAIYCEWEMDDAKWQVLQNGFSGAP